MNATRWFTIVSCCVLLLAADVASASGALGVHGIIERVVFEPNASAPERVRVYGAFSLYDRTRKTFATGTQTNARQSRAGAERGYLYFSLPMRDTEHAAVRREWADLAAVAGTSEAVAFASYGFIGAWAEARVSADALVEMPVSEYRGVSRELIEQMGADRIGLGTVTLRVWPESADDAKPIRYALPGVGVVRLGEGNHDDIVAELRAALAGSSTAGTPSDVTPANVSKSTVGSEQSEGPVP